MMFTTTSCPMPGPAGTISGPTTSCGNSIGNVYSVAPIANATGYNWTLPPGAVITAGANTNSVTVNLGNTSGNVSVYGTDMCGNGTASSLAATINIAPVPTITGPNSMCVKSGFYYYTTEPGMTNYIWVTSPGGNITWGQGTNQVQVNWIGSGAQTISVNYISSRGCPGATGQTYLAIQTGEYWVVVTLNGCSSDPSNHIYVVLLEFKPFRFLNLPFIPSRTRAGSPSA